MPTWVKVLLIVVVILALLSLAAAGLGVYLWRQHGRGFVESAQQTVAEGKEYGAHTDSQGCLDESLARHARASGFGEIIKVNAFLSACLDASRPAPGFCDDVPRQLEFIKSAQWQQQQCEKHGLSMEKQCGQLFSQVQKHCELRHPSRK
ncbi:MAG TPA: hypothetical protein VFS10_02005 [Pyrinomonadaceae bacterium]|nr:hypothetical protein [Pyrinomonadaceae bacterium]